MALNSIITSIDPDFTPLVYSVATSSAQSSAITTGSSKGDLERAHSVFAFYSYVCALCDPREFR